MDTSKPIALVTGATSGIGLVTARTLAGKGYHLLLVGRDEHKTQQARESIVNAGGSAEAFVADLSQMQSVLNLSNAVRNAVPQLDVLVNNAGGVSQRRELTAEGLERTFATNHLAYFLLTRLLLELLKKAPSARIVNVSSNSHYSGKIDFENLQGEKSYSVLGMYANTKLYNVLFTYELARRLKGSQITANCLHPGVIRTQIGNKNTNWFTGLAWQLAAGMRGIPVEQGAATSIYLASSPDVQGISGRYFEKCKEKQSALVSYDEALAARLWQVSENLCQPYLP